MSAFNDTGYLPVTLTATVAKYQRVDFDGTVAGDDEVGIGVACQAGVSGDTITVASHSKPGTYVAIAAGAIAVGAIVHTAADGEVNDTQATGAFPLGFAITAATADQDLIEILPAVGETAGS